MARLIDADAFLKSEIERCGCVPLVGSCTADNESFKFILEEQPTVEAESMKHGKWEMVSDMYGVEILKCSVCGTERTRLASKYCCDCGARMDGE